MTETWIEHTRPMAYTSCNDGWKQTHIVPKITGLLLRPPLCLTPHNLRPALEPQKMLARNGGAIGVVRRGGGERLHHAIPPTLPPVFQSHGCNLVALQHPYRNALPKTLVAGNFTPHQLYDQRSKGKIQRRNLMKLSINMHDYI